MILMEKGANPCSVWADSIFLQHYDREIKALIQLKKLGVRGCARYLIENIRCHGVSNYFCSEACALHVLLNYKE